MFHPFTFHATFHAHGPSARCQIADLLQHELIVGATGISSGSGIYPRALNALLGTKFKLITGFASSANVFLAMERGELDGSCDSLDSFMSRRPDWFTSRKAMMVFQGGTEPDPHLKDVPFVDKVSELIR